MLKAFNRFLVTGSYPFSKESGDMYLPRLATIVNLVMETDIPAIHAIDYNTVRNMRKLLAIISKSVPFVPNIMNLSRESGIHRNTVLKLIDLLDDARILTAVRSPVKGLSYLAKPEKIFLESPNLMHALVDDPNIGHLRETFFINQVGAVHDVHIPKYADFLVDGRYLFEIGGPVKSAAPADVPEAWLALDGIKGGSGKRIPLWMFGLLY
jgi:predicted AAA+ superfamily ATPase